MAEDSNDEQSGTEIDIPLVLGPVSSLFASHKYLQKLLALDTADTLLTQIFGMLAALCDPMTQPEDNEKVPLSVELLSQVAISLSYQILLRERRKIPNDASDFNWLVFDQPEVASLRFTISLKFFTILQAMNKVLRADDELRVRYLQNDRGDWESTAKYWLPDVPQHAIHDADACIKLLYYMSCVAVMTLYRLFLPEDGSEYSAALNPYTEYLLRLWKTHTSIIALALEMDRELEEEAWATKSDYLDTPDLVKRALLGSSAVRTVLAWILEQVYPGAMTNDDDSLTYDVCKSPLVMFYDPLARTTSNCGCIMREKQLLMVVSLIVRSHISLSPVADDYAMDSEVDFPIFDSQDYEFRLDNRLTSLGCAGDLMVDLYYHDQFDEDIKYVFGFYESDEESSAEDENDDASLDGETLYGTAKRAKRDEIEFDEDGRDWRDCARGQNVEYTQRFIELEAKAALLGEDSDDFFASWFELEQSFVFLASVKIESVSAFVQRVGQVTINTVAKAIRDEETKGKGSLISKIYSNLTRVAKKELRAVAHEEFPKIPSTTLTLFDLILIRNPECALAIVDELFMCKGLRRSLIWHLTQCVDISMTLINYIYELVSGMRGNSTTREAKYVFSRKGSLELSPVEISMALHELFGSASRWSLDDLERVSIPEENNVKLVLCLCLMISRLISNGVIKLTKDNNSFEDFSQDLQVLLFPWIGQVSEARQLFFKIKSESYKPKDNTDTDADGTDGTDEADEKNSNNGSDQTKSGLDIRDVLESLENLDYSDYCELLNEPPVQLAFVEFSQRLFYHICDIYKVSHINLKPLKPASSAHDDFNLFLTRFNDFSKNKTFVKSIYTVLEGVTAGERPDQMEAEDAITKDPEIEESEPAQIIESEFNDAFLNGEGHFQHGEPKKQDEKKKKKKKKKRGGKR